MSTPQIAPRSPFPGIVAVWVVGLVLAVVIGIVVPASQHTEWLAVGLAGCLVLAFAIQVAYARPEGFIRRVGLSMMGALIAMGLVGGGFAIAALMSVS